MNIIDIRRKGFATNSSSVHSIIVAGSLQTPNEGPSSGTFGWEIFLQSTPEEKLTYMVRALFDSLANCEKPIRSKENIAARKTIKELFGKTGLVSNGEGIGHQSSLSIPERINHSLALDFWKELSEAISNDPTVEICGGNDNGGDIDAELHPFWSGIIEKFNEYLGKYVVRKENDVWTLFNYQTGEKVHISLDKIKYVDSFKPSAPELVDLKITDKCLSGCSYCYQNSSHAGRHARFADIAPVLKALGDVEVFEIAIGGGEPTLHPKFWDIVRMTRDIGMIPNFSTRNYEFISSNKFIDNFKLFGGIGVSADTRKEAQQYMDLLARLDGLNLANMWNATRLVMHYVIDAHPMSRFVDMLEVISANSNVRPHILLLGKKLGGRSISSHYDNTGWSLMMHRVLRDVDIPIDISIDTLVANRYPQDLENINRKFFYREEGRYSLYIDAVERKFGKASYGVPLIPYYDVKEALEAFKHWEPEKVHVP